MKLLTKEIEKKFAKTPLYSTDGQGMNAEVLVKYFNPCGIDTWLITEAEKQDNGDYLLYGYCKMPYWEWGYVLLSELENIRLPLGLTIERDLFAKGTVYELSRGLVTYSEPVDTNDEPDYEEER